MEIAAIEAMESEHDFFVSMDLLVNELKHLGISCNIPFSFVDIPLGEPDYIRTI